MFLKLPLSSPSIFGNITLGMEFFWAGNKWRKVGDSIAISTSTPLSGYGNDIVAITKKFSGMDIIDIPTGRVYNCKTQTIEDE